MVSVRTNLCTNPRYIGPDGTSGGVTWTQTDQPSSAPDGGPRTRLVAATDATGHAFVGVDEFGGITPGLTYTGSTYVQGSRAGLPVQAWLQFLDATTGNVTEYFAGDITPMLPGTAGIRISATGAAPDGVDRARIVTRIVYDTAGPVVLTGDAVSVAMRMIEQTSTLATYFDGDYPNTETVTHAWTGESNASTSTETTINPPSITAEVLTRKIPVAQVVVHDLPAGASYEVIGTAGGYTWPLPGGVGVADGSDQIILVDTRAPFNVPVTYQLTYDASGYASSNTVTLPLTGGVDVVLATIDGALEVVPASLGAGEFPRAVTPRVQVYQVPGRARGPVRWSPAARTGSTWELHCDMRQSAALDALLSTGRPLVYRLATPVRDLAPTDLIVVTEVSSTSFPDEDAWRTWTLNFEYIDDPEPSNKPVVTSWDEFDEVYAEDTWDQFDADWAGSTWDDFDTFDWGQLQ